MIEGGVEVIGCASAGALRAVELEAHGMKGAGLVFDLYREGHVSDDAEIACVLGADYRAIAPPLLELRMIFGRLAIEVEDDRALRTAFGAIASVNFFRRDRAALRRIAEELLDDAVVRLFDEYLDNPIFALKARDLERVTLAAARGGEL